MNLPPDIQRLIDRRRLEIDSAQVENNNTVNTVNTNNTDNTDNTVGIFTSDEVTIARKDLCEGPLGPFQEKSVESQKSQLSVAMFQEKMGDTAAPGILSELDKLKSHAVIANQWITQNQVDYVKASVYPETNKSGDWTTWKISYSLKLKSVPLNEHKYTSRITSNYLDYRQYIKTLWGDTAPNEWHYPLITEYVKTSNKQQVPAFAGRCSRNIGQRKTGHKMPNLPFTSVLMYFDIEEDAWELTLYHNDFQKTMSIPEYTWNSALATWMDQHSNKPKWKKGSTVPPMISFEWRNLL